MRLAGQIGRNDHDGALDSVQTDDFRDGMSRAYKSKDGYHVGQANGEKVMFVAGSRNQRDHINNLADLFLPQGWHTDANRKAKKWQKIANEQGVDVVAGHSRGAQIVSKMETRRAKKIGLDGAMVNAKDKTMMNLANKGGLGVDSLIDRGPRSSITTALMSPALGLLTMYGNSKRGRNTKSYAPKRGESVATSHHIYKRGRKPETPKRRQRRPANLLGAAARALRRNRDRRQKR